MFPAFSYDINAPEIMPSFPVFRNPKVCFQRYVYISSCTCLEVDEQTNFDFSRVQHSIFLLPQLTDTLAARLMAFEFFFCWSFLAMPASKVACWLQLLGWVSNT